MEYNFANILEKAKEKCEDKKVYNEANSFGKIYPFTTENISGYIDLFNLKDRSLLTVGSSGDQIINAILKGCKDVTLLDINPFTKYYYYLKIACLLCLDKDTFMEFLHYQEHTTTFGANDYAFNYETFNKVKQTLAELDHESYLFWNELFKQFKPLEIRTNMFEPDEYKIRAVIGCNNYLHDVKLYKDAQEKIMTVKPHFVYGDIFNVKFERKFDNIWLSNIGKYLNFLPAIREMVDITDGFLNDDGQLLICYLYDTMNKLEYNKGWPVIYNQERVNNVLKGFHPQIESFTGVIELMSEENKSSDSIYVYKKNTIN